MSSRSESTFEPSPRYRPVVALEIDGVLDLPVSGPQAPEHLVEIELTVKRDLFPSSTRHQPEWMDGEWRARHWISKIGLSWIQSLLAAQIEVVWASTWREYANVYFTDSIGLPHLPVATRLDGGRHENLSKWKASGLDNLIKGLLDSMNKVVYRDDSQIQCVTVRRVDSNAPRGGYIVRAVEVHPFEQLTLVDDGRATKDVWARPLDP